MDLKAVNNALLTFSDVDVEKTIAEFNKKALERFQFARETAESKVELAKTLSCKIDHLLSVDGLDVSSLVMIRVLSRDQLLAKELSTSQILNAVFNAAHFGACQKGPSAVRLEAKKCCCNLLYQSEQARSEFGLYNELADAVGSEEADIHREELLYDVKIVFLLSGLCRSERRLIDGELFHDSLFYVLETLVNECIGPMTEADAKLANETCKALFNVLSLKKCADDADQLGPKIGCRMASVLRQLLVRPMATSDSEYEVRAHAINLLTLLHPKYYVHLVANEGGVEPGCLEQRTNPFHLIDTAVVNSMLDVLSLQCDENGKAQEFARPTLTLLTHMAQSNKLLRLYVRLKVLPPLKDVYTRPEVGQTLRSKVVRLMTSVTDVNMAAAEFLFALCNSNVDRLVKYTGFGNAAGLLSSTGLLATKKRRSGDTSSEEDSDTEEYLKMKDKINPVTGCYEAPVESTTDSMTEEQKEYEAQQLVTQLDKLMRQGLIVPGTVGEDGKVLPMQHVLQMQQPSVKYTKKRPS